MDIITNRGALKERNKNIRCNSKPRVPKDKLKSNGDISCRRELQFSPNEKSSTKSKRRPDWVSLHECKHFD